MKLFRLIVTLLLVATLNGTGADKNGVSPNSISLPKGPGSIEGLGESFQPTLNTGTAKYSVGLKVGAGTAGHQPSLALRYDGGGGNGPLGYGWSLPLGYIQRRTDKGIPTYGQSFGVTRSDTYINEAKEELVPQTNGFFFCENEGAFVRYRQVGNHWEGTAPDGTRLEFGLTANARIEDSNAGQVFSWLIERETDVHGNVIRYSYSSFPGEQNLQQKYLTAVHYGPGGPPWANFHFIRFVYEDRPDWFEDGRAGFIVRTGKRLKSIVVGTQGPQLPGHLQGDFDADGTSDYLNRRYDLDYLQYAGTNSHWSLLFKVTPVGADGASTLPPSTFGYAICDPPDELSASDQVLGAMNEPPFVMDNDLVELADLNADGLPDILKTELGGGAHQAFLNRGQVQLAAEKVIRWDPPADVDPGTGTAWAYNLSSSSTHLADMDGDGLADLVHKTTEEDIFYFRNLGRIAWGERQPMSVENSAPPSPFGEPNVRTADIDFDKRIDTIQSIASGDGVAYRIWFNLGNQSYSPAVTVEDGALFTFSAQGVDIADCNGDRVPDVARVQAEAVIVTAGLGYGRFASARNIPLPDLTLDDSQVRRARLTDLNGDGLADLVIERAAPGECWFWLNLGNYTLSSRKIITGLPGGLSLDAAVRWADINGNGTTDLIYADREATPKIQAVDLGGLLNCHASPNVLTVISNGIGRVTLISYESSTTFALADALAGQPWPNVMPMPVSVVAAVTNLDSLGHEYVTRFYYHDGYYDSDEKQFRGFARVEQIEIGDASAPTLVRRSYFHTGHDFEAMKGKLLRLITEQEDGKVFNDESTVWTTPPKILMTGTNGQTVKYVHPVAQNAEITELGVGTARRLESELSYDDYGNETRNADYGIVVNGERAAFDDERITVTQYALNLDRWILRNANRQEIQDENGVVISRTESYYDDETFSGNNLGQITIGNATMTRAWINPANPLAYVKATRSKYDAYGNRVALLDPLAVAPNGTLDLAQGHVREIAFDARFHTYPVRETIHVGAGSEPLIFQAEYDEGFGTPIRSLNFNQHATTYGFDTFARVTSIIKPHDSAEFPTFEYGYFMAVSFGSNGLVNFVETRQLDQSPDSAGPNKRDHYLISRQFTDGLGRTLMAKTEAEPAPGSTTPRVVISGAVVFNARQQSAYTLNPHFSTQTSGSLDGLLAFENVEAPGWTGLFEQNGQLVPLGLAVAHKLSLRYDATLRITQTANPDQTFNRTVYEPLVTKAFDENDTDPVSPHYNTPTVQFLDGLGRLVRLDEISRLNDDGTPSGDLKTWTTSYRYSLNDQIIRIIDSQNNVKVIEYDSLKRKTFMNDPDCGQVSYAYDDASNLRETIDAKDQRITYTYDGANRIKTEEYHDEASSFSYRRSPDVLYHYDRPATAVEQGDGTHATARNTKGMLAYVQDTSGEEHISYDDEGHIEWTVKRIPDPILEPSSNSLVSYKTSFEYDALDRVSRMIYPDNDEVTYRYNSRGVLHQVLGGPSGSIISGIAYHPSGQQRQINYGNGIETKYQYDSRMRLTDLGTRQPQLATDLIDFAYTFDGVSNIRSIQDQRPTSAVGASDKRRNTQTFTYDDLYRLTRVQYNLPAPVTSNGGEINYRYDRIGNMLDQTSDISHFEKGLPLTDLGPMSYGGASGRHNRAGRSAGDPPGPHALTAIQSRNYEYDPNGNMTLIDGLRCTWDFKDRLVAVEDDTMRAEYTYDYTDRRITKRVTPKQSNSNPTNSSPRASASDTSSAVAYVGKHFEVREHDQPTKYIFAGANRVARVTGSLSFNSRIQRFRLNPGWNLLSLAVVVDDFSGQIHRNLISPLTVYRWNQESADYSLVLPTQTVPADTILWVKANTNAIVAVTGAYSDPVNQEIPSGGRYIAAAGLEAWTPTFTSPTAMWRYPPGFNQWQARLGGDLSGVTLNLPPPSSLYSPFAIPPGKALYINFDAPAELEVPPPALRIRYYHQDYLGSSSVITDAQGALVEETAYYPFGPPRNNHLILQLEESYNFTQKERDRETGLHQFQARYLTGRLSRFLTTDPKYANFDALSENALGTFLSDPQQINLYAYVGNNPIVYVDPSGLDRMGRHEFRREFEAADKWRRQHGVTQQLEVDWGIVGSVAIIAVSCIGGVGVGCVVGGAIGADQLQANIRDEKTYLNKGLGAGLSLVGGEKHADTAEFIVNLAVGGASLIKWGKGLITRAPAATATSGGSAALAQTVPAGAAAKTANPAAFAKTAAPEALANTAPASIGQTGLSSGASAARVASDRAAALAAQHNAYMPILVEQQQVYRAARTIMIRENMAVDWAYQAADEIVKAAK